MRKHRKWIIVGFFGLVSAAAFVIYRFEAERRAERLEAAIAGMPIGITAAEAARWLGAPPDAVHRESGVLVQGSVFLAAGNADAARYGQPQTYDMHVWRRCMVTATLYIDGDGRVAASTTSGRPPAGWSRSLGDRVRAFIESLR